MSKLRKGQKVILWDDDLGPFKGVVREKGIEALEDICWTKSGNRVVEKGYVMYSTSPPDEIAWRLESTRWSFKPVIEMEENE